MRMGSAGRVMHREISGDSLTLDLDPGGFLPQCLLNRGTHSQQDKCRQQSLRRQNSRFYTNQAGTLPGSCSPVSMRGSIENRQGRQERQVDGIGRPAVTLIPLRSSWRTWRFNKGPCSPHASPAQTGHSTRACPSCSVAHFTDFSPLVVSDGLPWLSVHARPRIGPAPSSGG
jgi:hypothetical protein